MTESANDDRELLERAVKRVGSLRALAQLLGVGYSAAKQWRARGSLPRHLRPMLVTLVANGPPGNVLAPGDAAQRELLDILDEVYEETKGEGPKWAAMVELMARWYRHRRGE